MTATDSILLRVRFDRPITTDVEASSNPDEAHAVRPDAVSDCGAEFAEQLTDVMRGRYEGPGVAWGYGRARVEAVEYEGPGEAPALLEELGF